MKFLDEYRDAEAAHKYAREIARVTTRPWTLPRLTRTPNGGRWSVLTAAPSSERSMIRQVIWVPFGIARWVIGLRGAIAAPLPGVKKTHPQTARNPFHRAARAAKTPAWGYPVCGLMSRRHS